MATVPDIRPSAGEIHGEPGEVTLLDAHFDRSYRAIVARSASSFRKR